MALLDWGLEFWTENERQRAFARQASEAEWSRRRRMFDGFDVLFGPPSPRPHVGRVVDGVFTWELQIPGTKRDDISVELLGREVTVMTRKDGRDGTRAFTLAAGIDLDTLGCRYEDGVLTLTANTTPETRPRKIDVR